MILTKEEAASQDVQARDPFHFNASGYLLRIGKEKAATPGELLQTLRKCSDDSIFQHTFRTLQEHHFLGEGYWNDFSHWMQNDCHEITLAEQLAGVDIRNFTAISDLRQRLVGIVEDYLQQNPKAADKRAGKPFYFCGSDTVVFPTSFTASNLAEFIDALQKVSVHSIHHHFIEARLRLKLRSNDFSLWLETEVGQKSAADKLNEIDIYTSTLEDVRQEIVHILQDETN